MSEATIEKSARPGDPPPVLAEPLADAPEGRRSYLRALVRGVFAIAEMDLRKLRHDPLELLTRAVQPALWLLIFGRVMSAARAIPTGDLPYLDFLTPGILAQSVMFIAIFYGISVIWERDLGIVSKMLVSATPRTALVAGKALAAGVRGLSQALVIYLLALTLGIGLNFGALNLLGVLAAVILGAAAFATFSLIIACIVKTRERFMGIGQVLTMPLFFASNAVYPIAMMPPWLKVVARANPLSYEVDALRTLMLHNAAGSFSLVTDFSVLVIATVVMTLICAKLYPRILT